MTRNDLTGDGEFIRQLEVYLDEYQGLTPLPDAVRDAIRAELPMTKQIGPVSGLMRDIYMTSTMDSPARWGLVAAVIIGAVIIGGALFFGDGNVGGPDPSPSAAPTSTPTPGAYAPEDLPTIVLTADNVPAGLTVDGGSQGAEAYAVPFPEGFEIDYTGFGDAMIRNLNSTEGGGLVSWAVVFGTADQAGNGLDQMRRAHEDVDGWGLTPSTVTGLGDDAVSYVGPAYAFDAATIYLWRVDNLVLAAVAVGDADPQLARDIADEMHARTQGP